MRVISDSRGRIPFAVLGVFLLIGSAVTSGIVSNLEREHSKGITIFLKAESTNYAVKYAEADISRILSYSFLQALKKVGESPVTYSNLSTQAAKDYADEDGDGKADEEIVGDNGVVDTFYEAVNFNKNWARNMAKVSFNRYINSTFRNGIYRYGDYLIDVFDPDNNGAVDNWRDIEIDEIKMELDREVYIKSLISEENNSYPVYWKAHIKNLEIEVRNLSSGRNFIQSINVSCLVPSRLPLMMSLVETYKKSINGISPLMGLVTLIGEGCTEARSLLQYAGKYNWVSNIVDNRWLQYLTNTGLVSIQYLVFNSIDPLELAYLAVKINDLVSKSNVEENDKYVKEESDDAIRNEILGMISLPIDYKEDIFRTFGNGTDRKAEKELKNFTKSEFPESGNGAVWNVARGILNDSMVTYYYFNESANPNLVLENEWRGYEFDKNGYVYHLSTPNGDSGNQKTFDIEYLPHVNSTVMKKIYEEIENTYSASFATQINRIKMEESYSTSFSGNWRGPINCEKWNLVSSKPEGSILSKGKIPSSMQEYRETWVLEWKRNETWEHEEDGWISCNITHTYKEKVIFALIISDYQVHIQNIFHNKTIFGYRQDDNLEFLLRKYVDNHFIRWRDYYTDTDRDEGIGKNLTLSCENWKNNTADGDDSGYEKIEWLVDECLSALYNITEMIKKDGKEYGNISGDFNITAANLSLLDRERDLILEKFENNKEKYLDSRRYIYGNEYKSAAAKVVFKMKEWFIDEIKKKLNVSYSSMAEEEINKELKRRGAVFENYGDYESAVNEYKDGIGNLKSIHFGNKIKLSGEWKENASLSLNAIPHYFDFKNPPSEEEDWQFDVKNICLFGPTGLPLLPTPVTPWVVTINSWYIHVEGHWDTFEVLDSNDETHPDPLFGHVSQAYVMKRKPVFDSICHPESNPEIGQCRRLKFGFDTISLGIVPSGRLPIGDLDKVVESDSVGR